MASIFKTENSTRINFLVRTKSANSLYAEGEDSTVFLFSIPNHQAHPGGGGPCVLPGPEKDGSILAMASRNIHIWDVSSKKVNKTVTGHANPVTRMEIAGNYLYSSSDFRERMVFVWDLDWRGRRLISVRTLPWG